MPGKQLGSAAEARAGLRAQHSQHFSQAPASARPSSAAAMSGRLVQHHIRIHRALDDGLLDIQALAVLDGDFV